MMKKLLKNMVLPLCLASSTAMAGGMSDDPLITYLKFDQLEWRDADEGTLMVWEVDAWVGRDLDKLWFKLSGERVNGETESQTLDILHSKAVTAYWDMQYGIRTELSPKPSKNWIGVGFMGVAPYQIEMDVSAFANEDGLIHFSLSAEYEYMFSQRIELVPEIELSLFTDDDAARGIESGLGNVEIGFRLSYQIEREFAPYIGLNYESKDGKKFESQLLIGVRTWF
jgi:copper resistance protein B